MADQGWEQVAAEAVKTAALAEADAVTTTDDYARDLIARLAAIVRQQAAEVARLRAEREQLANALRRLTREVRGCWDMDEPTLRHELGNTNYSAVEGCIAAALAALTPLAAGEAEGA